MIPVWLHALSLLGLGVGVLCALGISLDELAHPQRMWIMNLVWPVSALYGSGWIVWHYVRFGRQAETKAPKDGYEPSLPVAVANGALHCGSGCALGDLCAEWIAYAFPSVALALGWRSLFADELFAVWILDFILAYAFGIIFQYFTIAPMRGLSPGAGLLAAVKADTLSLTFWQIGMYGFMAIAQFVLFQRLLGVRLTTAMPEFWFMMQIAMLCGFATSYPVNWWLIKRGLKEKM